MDALADTQRLDQVLLDSYMVNCDGVSVLPGMRQQRPGLVPSTDGLSVLLELSEGVSTTPWSTCPQRVMSPVLRPWLICHLTW